MTHSIRRTARTAGTAASAVLSLALAASTAPAHAATHYVDTFDFSTPAQPLFSAACGFPVAFHVSGSANVVELSRNGATVKEIRNYRAVAEISAHGTTLRGWLNGPEITQYVADGSYTVAAMGIVGRKSDEGVFLQQVGRVVTSVSSDGTEVEVFRAGQAEDFDELCRALLPS